MLLQDAGGLMSEEASEAIFGKLLQLPPAAFASVHVHVCVYIYTAYV